MKSVTLLAVDFNGAWVKKASLFFNCFAQVAARLAIHKSLPKSQASFDLFSNLSICLNRANARAILRRVHCTCLCLMYILCVCKKTFHYVNFFFFD